ncbi:MAG TPA: xylose isomerase [Planctomycetaceae bacterium]|nr:xylose isomerase [Planctomycetaceae bacterium]
MSNLHRNNFASADDHESISRRNWIAVGAAAISVAAIGPLPHVTRASEPKAEPFAYRFLLASSLYGYGKLEEIVPLVRSTGATAIDIWPKVHGDQREQIDAMGEPAFADLLARNDVTLGCITQYKLGPFGLADEMRLAQRLGCKTIVTGAVGPRGLGGKELKFAVSDFVEKMKPHLEMAQQTGVTIAIENHANNLVDSPDAIRWLAELCPSTNLAIALAPYHLAQDPIMIAKLISDIGDRMAVFYAWQHGNGSMAAQPKESELLQMPGRGDLDFEPIVAALRRINYQGWTEIFMHSYPRGTAILNSINAVTDEVKRGAAYMNRLAGLD